MTEKTNIVLITSPRSGSTWFLDQIEKENPGMKNHRENLRTLVHGYEIVPRTVQQRKAQFRGVLRDWQNPDVSNCLKIFPLMITEPKSPWRKPTFMVDLLDDATHCYFLMRKNFPAQVKSAIVAFYKTMIGQMNFHGNWDDEFAIPDNDQTRKLVRTCERQMYAQNFQLITMWYNTPTDVPTELLWLEDLDQSGKYHRPVTWENEPIIDSIDWEEQFKEV